MNDEFYEFINSVRYARAEYERLSLRIKEMEAQAMKVTTTLSGTPGGGNADAQALWARIVDDTDELYRLQHTYLSQIKAVEEFCDGIENSMEREVMKLRYVNCLKWRGVEEALDRAGLCYDERTIYRIHRAAMDSAQELWAKKGERT